MKSIYQLGTENICLSKIKVKTISHVQIDLWILRIDFILWMNHLELILKDNIRGFTVVQLLGNSV